MIRPGGIACFVGALNGTWTITDFSPFSIPKGVRLTSYAGEAQDLPSEALDRYLQAVQAGTMNVVTAGVYDGLAAVGQAQQDLESGHRPGKHVVVLPAT